MAENGRRRIFISYNSKDSYFANELAVWLRARGFKAWIDLERIRPGIEWQVAIDDAVAQADMVIVCVGPNRLGKWQQMEIDAAQRRSDNGDCVVLPLLIPGGPSRLSKNSNLNKYSHLDMRNGLGSDDQTGRLLWAITGENPWADQNGSVLKHPFHHPTKPSEEQRCVLAERVQSHLRSLDRKNFPKDGICSHLGIWFRWMEFTIRLLVATSHGDRLLVTVESDGHRSWPRTWHESISKCLSVATGCEIITTWNGEEGSSGVSVVLDRQAPVSLIVGYHNYNRMANVLEPTDHEKAASRGWWHWYEHNVPVMHLTRRHWRARDKRE